MLGFNCCVFFSFGSLPLTHAMATEKVGTESEGKCHQQGHRQTKKIGRDSR